MQKKMKKLIEKARYRRKVLHVSTKLLFYTSESAGITLMGETVEEYRYSKERQQ